MDDFKTVEILLAEDNPNDAELTMRALRKNNLANNLVWVKDGEQALDFIFSTGTYSNRIKGHPRLIMLDLKMPKVNGIEVLQRIKSNEVTKIIPVVMLSSSAEERDIVESYKLGVNSYLVKPVDFTKFVDVVANAGLYWAVMNKSVSTLK
jgi:CheY-like chemotaxis protein